jgi:hypothetical protein
MTASASPSRRASLLSGSPAVRLRGTPDPAVGVPLRCTRTASRASGSVPSFLATRLGKRRGMRTEIELLPMGPREYAVTVTEGAVAAHHRVTIPEELIDAFGPDVDEETLVRESFEFLLEKEPVTAIEHEFSLDRISDFFPGYVDELRTRLS